MHRLRHDYLPPTDQTKTKKIIDAHFQSIDPLQHWADPYILLHPAFGTILAQVKAGATIFDHSDYFATDLRALAMHGAPTKKMLTYNSSAARWALSHEAFRDKGRFSITCLDGSAYLNPSKKWYVNDPFLPYRGSVDILWLPHRVYGLERAEQRSSILGLIERFRPTAGFMLVGCHEGSKVTRYEKRTGALGVREDAWIPNAEDFGKMLQEVLTPADGEWQVEVSLIELDQTEEFREYAAVKGKELLRFTCVRLD